MDPVVEQLKAYNDRDIDRFVSCYSPDVVVEDGEGNLVMKGHDEIRDRYGALFDANPDLHCHIVNRIRVGLYVIDEEEVTGFNIEGTPEKMHAVAIFRVLDDIITHVRMLT
jgi:hypothetical protein